MTALSSKTCLSHVTNATKSKRAARANDTQMAKQRANGELKTAAEQATKAAQRRILQNLRRLKPARSKSKEDPKHRKTKRVTFAPCHEGGEISTKIINSSCKYSTQFRMYIHDVVESEQLSAC